MNFIITSFLGQLCPTNLLLNPRSNWYPINRILSLPVITFFISNEYPIPFCNTFHASIKNAIKLRFPFHFRINHIPLLLLLLLWTELPSFYCIIFSITCPLPTLLTAMLMVPPPVQICLHGDLESGKL